VRKRKHTAIQKESNSNLSPGDVTGNHLQIIGHLKKKRPGPKEDGKKIRDWTLRKREKGRNQGASVRPLAAKR